MPLRCVDVFHSADKPGPGRPGWNRKSVKIHFWTEFVVSSCIRGTRRSRVPCGSIRRCVLFRDVCMLIHLAHSLLPSKLHKSIFDRDCLLAHIPHAHTSTCPSACHVKSPIHEHWHKPTKNYCNYIMEALLLLFLFMWFYGGR